MIHFHGGPVTPTHAAIQLWTRRHALVSFKEPRQAALAFEIAQSVMLDNGAFSLWQNGGGKVDVAAYAEWVCQWERHPGYHGAIIPDDIDGSGHENDVMIASWLQHPSRPGGIPVWHMHEDGDVLISTRCVLDAGHSGDHEDRRGRTWVRNDAAAQPAPMPNNGPRVIDLVLADLGSRAEAGRAKYGTYLQPNNGRDALRDAYEEALDLAMYLRQAIEERNT